MSRSARARKVPFVWEDCRLNPDKIKHAPRPAERAAMHEDDGPTFVTVRTLRGRVVEFWDYDDSWSYTDGERSIPGLEDWRLWEFSWSYDRDLLDDRDYDPYDSDYGWDNRGPEPSDKQWVELWVDGYEDTPTDWRWNGSDSCSYCEYEADDDDGDWDAIADEIANDPAPLPETAELRLDIPRALERQVRRERRRAARAA